MPNFFTRTLQSVVSYFQYNSPTSDATPPQWTEEYVSIKLNRMKIANNTLLLQKKIKTNTEFFTTQTTGDIPRPVRMFTGFVFRGDSREPALIFQHGFDLQAINYSMTPFTATTLMSGAFGNITSSFGISTTICYSVAEFYVSPPRVPTRGYVYLIDGSRIAGVSLAVPNRFKDEPLVHRYPWLRDTYEVNYPHNIPSQFIVGCLRNAPGHRLTLYINPNYLYDVNRVAGYFQSVCHPPQCAR